MSDFFYPTIPESWVLPLRAALTQMAANPGYLDNVDCPFSPSLKGLLRELSAPGAAGPSDYEAATDKNEYIELEIGRVITDLNLLQAGLGKADHTEKLAVAKARTGLIEKLISSRERIANVREMNQFVSRVMQFLDDLCTPDQITDLKNRLRGLTIVSS